ncbi:hypothetical protein, partial [Mycoplasma marinum]|uniref:Sugar ABC transporter substrate-binding protein n=1 Tax=Mycoplasma marinum TaxID=1937190 RepID=A0A4R0XS79_9MOLU
MNKKKKILSTTAFSLLAISMPIAVTSCGFGKKDEKVQTSKEVGKQFDQEMKVAGEADKKEIKVGVRTSEFGVYQKLAAEFNKYGKGKIKIEPLAEDSFKDLYDTKAAANAMPTVFVNDSNSMSVITNKHKWATGLKIEDFLGNKNKDLYDVAQKEQSFELKDINKSHLNANSDSRNMVYGVPVGYGTKGLVMNSTMIDGAKEIKSFVPYAKGGKSDTLDVEYKGGKKTFGKCGVNEIQKYISEAGDKTAASSEIVKAHGEASAWLGYGPGNTIQRIYSVARSCLSNGALNANVMALALKEGFANFGILASAGIVVDGQKIYDTKKKMLSTKVFNKVAKDDKLNSALSDYLWTSFGGYMTGSAASIINSNYLTKEPKQGEVEPFFNKQTLFTWNAKWAARMANEQWDKKGNNNAWKKPGTTYESNKGFLDGQIKVLSSPYGEVTGDSIAISNKASAVERLVAKRWIKFIMQNSKDFIVPKFKEGKTTYINQAPGQLITSKVVSAFEPTRLKQKSLITNSEKPYKDAWFNYGNNEKHTSSDEYNGINGQVWKITDSNNLSGLFEPALIDSMQSYYDASSQNKKAWTRTQFNNKLNDVARKYNGQLALKD